MSTSLLSLAGSAAASNATSVGASSSSTTSTTGSSSSASTNGTNALTQLGGNFQQFLSLLMAQLQNQDPTSPMDTDQFTSELVQFTGVQQEVATNSNLTSLISLTQQGQVLDSAQLVGKPADVTSSDLALQSGTGTIEFNSPSAQQVAIAVSNSAGTVVYNGMVNANAGTNTLVWNGQNLSGGTEPDGIYGIAIEGGSASSPQTLSFSVLGTVTGLNQTSNGISLQLGSLSVPMSSVLSIGN